MSARVQNVKVLANEDTLLRTYCCPWCFLGCANWETFVADTECFWTKSETFFVSRNKCCARGQTGKHLCRQQCVLVCQGLQVELICVRQTLLESGPIFNTRVCAFNKYVKTFLEALPYVFFWEHRGFWNASQRFLAGDLGRLTRQGQYKLFRSLWGSLLKSLPIFIVDH